MATFLRGPFSRTQTVQHEMRLVGMPWPPLALVGCGDWSCWSAMSSLMVALDVGVGVE